MLMLADYATKSNGLLATRLYPQADEKLRNPLERDRDRIIHSKALRRLSNKTQVFAQLPQTGSIDVFRSRLTHSLEVAQISRTIAEHLGLNTTLTECLALAHDIGHSPFGHSGEIVLAELMADHGGFEHNCQTLRQLCYLENRYYNYVGLNLCRITLLGLMKHGKTYKCDKDLQEICQLYKKQGTPLESQLVDLCDRIAYLHHDLEDGLEAKLLHSEDLEQLPFWADTRKSLPKTAIAHTSESSLEYKTRIRTLINHHICLIIEENQKRLRQGATTITCTSIEANFTLLKSYLRRHLYNHPKIKQTMSVGQDKLLKTFFYLKENNQMLPTSYHQRLKTFGLMRSICDYIAGMTDGYLFNFRIE